MRTSSDTDQLEISVEDFRECGWKQVVDGTDPQYYPALWEKFLAAAQGAEAKGNRKHYSILHLLFQVCLLRLDPYDRSMPFKAGIILETKRTKAPDDFTEEEINFLAQLIDEVDCFWLKARIADLVWVRNPGQGISSALKAIDAYRSIPVDTLFIYSKQCWERALALSKMIGKAGEERVTEIEKALCSTLATTAFDEREMVLMTADLLYEARLAKRDASRIAEILNTFGRQCGEEKKFFEGRDYFTSAAKWYELAGDTDQVNHARILRSESLEAEAAACLESDNPSHTCAACLYEEAIQSYRSIPRAARSAYDVNNRIEKLKKALSDSGMQSLQEMIKVRSPSIDIRKIIQEAENKVQGKSLEEALLNFANLRSLENVDAMWEAAQESLKKFPILSLLPTKIISADGRTIAKTASAEFNGTSNDEQIYVIMMKNYKIYVDLAVRGMILPAKSILYLEHQIHEDDFFTIVSHSPIIPHKRIRLFSKALYAGFNNDFPTCLHLLVPQIEHMVRYWLKASGIGTTTLDDKSIEMENGLSTLMDLPKTEEIFGKDLAFEIKALFCTPLGPNIRNNLAHGLLEEGFFYSTFSIYAWWLCFKIVYNAYWNTTRRISPFPS